MITKSSGFTLIELIIVLAIVAIIGAILIPNFINTSERARLRSDVQSARILQNALDLYNVEQSVPMTETSINRIIERLDYLGYVDEKRVTTQTDNANFAFQNGRIVLDISGNSKAQELRSMLSEQELRYVAGGSN